MAQRKAKGPAGTDRMRRILSACDAPPEIVADFDNLCRHWEPGDLATAEELLRDACRRSNFIAPWQVPGRAVGFRPYSLSSRHPDHRSDTHGDTPAEEQSYRRGFDQGANDVLQMLEAGQTLADVRKHLQAIHSWRVQIVQELGAAPGTAWPQELPERWKDI